MTRMNIVQELDDPKGKYIGPRRNLTPACLYVGLISRHSVCQGCGKGPPETFGFLFPPFSCSSPGSLGRGDFFVYPPVWPRAEETMGNKERQSGSRLLSQAPRPLSSNFIACFAILFSALKVAPAQSHKTEFCPSRKNLIRFPISLYLITAVQKTPT